MILSEGISTSARCAKMPKDEQRDRKDVLNGSNGECAATTVVASPPDREPPARTSYSQGGRLKFFKDGKFILELEHAREGERVSWVSVPRKTFWPPQGTASSTPSYRQESSTSLSVSDDNSSIQSSPWQRDHSWKQTNPRRNLSKEMCFFYRRPKNRTVTQTKKRRRPHDPAPEPLVKVEPRTPSAAKRPSLLVIVQSLLDRHSASSPPRHETVVSPRKRFLREMEKDCRSQAEDACQKRSRSKQQPATVKVEASSSPVLVSSASSNGVGGIADEVRRSTTQQRNSSYTITSLLADDRSLKKSPANSPSHYSPIAQRQYCSTPTLEGWCTENVDRLRSMDLSHAEKRLYSAYPHAPYVPAYLYPYPIPSPHYYPAFARNYPNMPSVYPIPLPVRPEAPSCSWTAEPARDTDHRDENITDMPLNLSKHGA